jgi:RsiW-degrading membrane proteinase PrsW (M82 family)
VKITLTVQDGALAGRTFDLDASGGALTLGRDDACGVPFSGDTRVSRKHAEVRIEGGGFVVADLGSTNGTLVNGQPVRSAGLKSGDLLKLGPEGPSLGVQVEGTRVRAAAQLEREPEAPAPAERTFASRTRPSLLETGLYDPAKDKGRSSNVLGVVIVFGMIGAGLFLGLLLVLMTFFSLGPVSAMIGTLVAFAPAPVYLTIWLWLDRNDPEPAWVLAGAFVWGAGAATFVSAIVNDLVAGTVRAATNDAALAAFLSASFSAPFIEELTKGLAVMLIFLFMRREFDGVLDGIVYAGLVALGFATVENVLYYGRAVAKEGLGGLLIVFVLRGVLGPFGHAVYTSMTGIGFGLARQSHNPLVKLVAPLVGFSLAAFLHFLWNTLAGLAGGAGFFILYFIFWMPLFLGFFGVVVWMGQRESKLIRRQLQFEVARGLLTTEQADLVSSWTRRTAWLLSSLSNRPRFAARRRFARGATRLALCYWHIERAQAAGGQTVSFSQLPQFQREVRAAQAGI